MVFAETAVCPDAGIAKAAPAPAAIFRNSRRFTSQLNMARNIHEFMKRRRSLRRSIRYMAEHLEDQDSASPDCSF